MVNHQVLYNEMREHLLNDERPSEYFNRISGEKAFGEYPFTMLQRLKEVPQSPKHHPEGNVWNHTMLVVDEAAENKVKSSDPEVFLWAALLHDIGKADTTRTRKGRITAYNHEKVGAELAVKFLKEFLEDDKKIQRIVALIRWHMQILFVTKSMEFADIKTMLKETELEEIALLGYCDRMGRLNADREAEMENLKLFLEKCRKSELIR
jgi:putative nucleotidyltransferase with HDIG domain